MRKIIYIPLLLLVCKFSLSQQANPLVTNGYLGYSISQPHFKNKGFERSALWEGVEAGFGGMSFSFHQGQLREIGADSSQASPSGHIFNIGYRLGKDFNIGRNSFFSTGVKPYVQISASTAI